VSRRIHLVGVMLVGASLLAGCAKSPAKTANDKASRREGRYHLGDPGDGWRRQRAGGADHTWYHPELFASIYTDSNCKSRYQDGPLVDLITHLTFGVARGEPVFEQRRTLDRREALLRQYEGSLDGVAVTVGAVVTKKHRCVYDLLYIAPPSTFDQGWDDFMQVVEGFEVRTD
jgi:hypothetical protein